MAVSKVETLKVEDAQLQAVKNKIQLVLTHLISNHIKNKSGTYYEIQQETDKNSIVYTMSTKPPRIIAKLMLPYVLWVVVQYLKRVYGVDPGYFSFSKKADPYLQGVYHLDVQINEKATVEISIVLMFMVVVFQDHFESDHTNQIAINRLCYLLVD